ncbi:hypothetical protein C2E23DRAFT_732469 [Lenzites betulinus]|nr:hypothetical protein C2E23DRAFT_732469 [Lenzites betulinus]
MQKKGKAVAEPAQEEDESGSKESDDEGDPSTLVHESLLKDGTTKGQSRNGKAKYVPSEETADDRDARTLFVGNVAVEITKSRPMQKQLKRHLLSFVPSAKIESVRFRSVAFKKPTAELPTDEDGKPKKTRTHDRERTASWRADQDGEAEPVKSFLTPQEKKRIAFIKQEIHDGIDAVNAYVVFAHAPPAGSRPSNLPPLPTVMDPREAARTCAELADGSLFQERTLRVDIVKKDAAGGGARTGAMAGDPRATVFVGNLEFTSKEEDLRAFFESVVRTERGEPGERADGESSGSEEEDEEARVPRARAWVKRVRIIRDRDTQLGKGFAYVQFVDRESVDEILALEEGKLKFAKRKLRVQRCKTLPGGPKLTAVHNKKAARASASAHSKSAPNSNSRGPNGAPGASRPRPVAMVPVRIPKGNPELGAKLAHLPKEERKQAKATDADRVARRIAKKRAKVLAEKGVKSRSGDKERDRVRKPRAPGGTRDKGHSKPQKRVRSGKAISKMNTKK